MGQIKVTRLDIEGLCIIEPAVHGDERGYFMETYNAHVEKGSSSRVAFSKTISAGKAGASNFRRGVRRSCGPT